MKKLIVVSGLCLFVAAAVWAQDSRGGTMYVGAKTVNLKSSTGFFAKTQATLSYGAQVTVLQVNGKWREVRSSSNVSLRGWTAAANLTAKRVVSGNTGSASAKEVALAGKGFNQEVEDAYKTKGGLNYADVDLTESQNVSDRDLYTFLVDGHLATGE
ncbi:MAG: hypothetical protein LBG57_10010 [Treponema sp.]|jgi:uncharacterized protein YgiM (DUF1202 family)|nr:hypothetical protein [Treponema sp.]